VTTNGESPSDESLPAVSDLGPRLPRSGRAATLWRVPPWLLWLAVALTFPSWVYGLWRLVELGGPLGGWWLLALALSLAFPWRVAESRTPLSSRRSWRATTAAGVGLLMAALGGAAWVTFPRAWWPALAGGWGWPLALLALYGGWRPRGRWWRAIAWSWPLLVLGLSGVWYPSLAAGAGDRVLGWLVSAFDALHWPILAEEGQLVTAKGTTGIEPLCAPGLALAVILTVGGLLCSWRSSSLLHTLMVWLGGWCLAPALAASLAFVRLWLAAASPEIDRVVPGLGWFGGGLLVLLAGLVAWGWFWLVGRFLERVPGPPGTTEDRVLVRLFNAWAQWPPAPQRVKGASA
jgi:hypothetical protein